MGEPFQTTWQELETCPRLSVVQPPVQMLLAAAVAAGPDARAAPEVRNNAFRNSRGDRPSAASGPRSSLSTTSRQGKSNHFFLSLCTRAHPSCYSEPQGEVDMQAGHKRNRKRGKGSGFCFVREQNKMYPSFELAYTKTPLMLMDLLRC